MAQFAIDHDQPISIDNILVERKDMRTVALMAASIWAARGISGFDASYTEVAADAVRLYAAVQLAMVYHNKGRLAKVPE